MQHSNQQKLNINKCSYCQSNPISNQQSLDAQRCQCFISLQNIHQRIKSTKNNLSHKLLKYQQQIQLIHQNAIHNLAMQKQATLKKLKSKQIKMLTFYQQSSKAIQKYNNRKITQLKPHQIINLQYEINKQNYWNQLFQRIVNRFKTIALGLPDQQLQALLNQHEQYFAQKKISTKLVQNLENNQNNQVFLIQQIDSKNQFKIKEVPILKTQAVGLLKSEQEQINKIDTQNIEKYRDKFKRRVVSQKTLSEFNPINSQPKITIAQGNTKKNRLKYKQLSCQSLYSSKNSNLITIKQGNQIIIKSKGKQITKLDTNNLDKLQNQ